MYEERKYGSPDGGTGGVDDELSCLKYNPNSDSLVLSDSDSRIEDGALTPSKSIISDCSSWTPSLSLPESFLGDDDDILADIPLPSLGEAATARKLISSLVHPRSDTDYDRQVLDRLTSAENLASEKGYSALRALGAELHAAKGEAKDLRAEVGRLKKALGGSKEDLSDLSISESLFRQLSRSAPQDLTLKEYACLRAASIYLPLREELQRTIRSLEETQVALEVANDTVQSQQDMLNRSRKLHEARVEELRLDLLQSEDRAGRLSARLEEQTQAGRIAQDMAERCGAAEKETQSLRAEVKSLRDTLTEQSAALQSVGTSESRLSTMCADAQRERDLLALDKEFLQKEVAGLVLRGNEVSRKADSQSDTIRQLEAKVSDLTDQLVGVQAQSRGSFDERMEREVQRLRTDYEKEMAALRESSREISERENRVLREVRSSLEEEVTSLKRSLADRDKEATSLVRELSEVRAAKDAELMKAQAEVKLKSFEVTALGATYEERVGQLKEVQLELEVTRQEVNAHRLALLKMETECGSKESLLREDLSRAHETLRAYELMLHTSPEDGTGLNAVQEWSARVGGSEIGWNADGSRRAGGIPLPVTVLASDPRRLRQLLDSSERNAKKLSEQQQLIAKLEGEVQARGGLVEEAQERERVMQRVVEATRHPAKYAIARLQEKEEEFLSAQKECVALRSRGAELERLVKAEREVSEQLRDRLRLLLEQRAEIEGLRALLQTVCVGDTEEGEEDYGSDGNPVEEDDEYGHGSGDFEAYTLTMPPPGSGSERATCHDLDRDGIGDHSHDYSYDEESTVVGVGVSTDQVSPRQPGRLTTSSEVMSTPASSSKSSPPHEAHLPPGSGSNTHPPASPGNGRTLAMSPAAVRAMTERNKGTGPSRTRVITGTPSTKLTVYCDESDRQSNS